MSKDAILETLSTKHKTVASIVAESGLSDSVVRKALKALVEDEQIHRHDTTPVTFTKDVPYSLEATVAQFLGNKARSADYITRRMRQRGMAVSTLMVSSALGVLVSSGRAVAPFKSSARYRRA